MAAVDTVELSDGVHQDQSNYLNDESSAAEIGDHSTIASRDKLSDNQQKYRNVIRGSKAPEIPLYERKNWLLHLHYIRKDYNTCKALIEELLTESNGQCEYAIYVKGVLLRQEGLLNDSLEYFQQAVRLNPHNSTNVKQVARSLFLLGSYKASLETYTEAEKISVDWEILHNKGICYVHLKQYNDALDNFTKAIQLSPQIESYKELGRVHLLLGDLHKAADVYRKAKKQNPEDSDLLANLGILYLQIGSSQKAFECLGSALTFDPSNYKALLAAGSIIQSHSDYDVSLSKYRIAANNSPESPHLWNNIGMCYYGKNKYVAAISCLKRATYLAPFEWKILYNLGLVHLAMTQYASAFHFLRAAQRLQPQDPYILMLLGAALGYLNDTENSLKAYQQSIYHSTSSDDPVLYLNYSIALFNNADIEGAVKHYRMFQMKLRALPSDSVTDSEITNISTKLAAVLQVGDIKHKKKMKQEHKEGMDVAVANENTEYEMGAFTDIVEEQK